MDEIYKSSDLWSRRNEITHNHNQTVPDQLLSNILMDDRWSVGRRWFLVLWRCCEAWGYTQPPTSVIDVEQLRKKKWMPAEVRVASDLCGVPAGDQGRKVEIDGIKFIYWYAKGDHKRAGFI